MNIIKPAEYDWAHVKMSLGIDPTKYIHVLVPFTPDHSDDSPMLATRFSNHRDDIVVSQWVSNYTHHDRFGSVVLRGLNFIYNQRYKTLADIIELVGKSQAKYINDNLVILESDQALQTWLSQVGNRSVQWRLPAYHNPIHQQYLLLTESVEGFVDDQA